MPQSCRIYRKRNSKRHDDKQHEPFFSKQYVQHNQNNTFFQPKLTVNRSGDQYEKEADNIANEVVNKNTATHVLQQKNISNVQQNNTGDEQEQTNEVQKKEHMPSRTKQEKTSAISSPISSKIENPSGRGNTLPEKTLNEMESSFGADFSNVHIHKDSEAADMNKELNAQAFTHGNDIYFNEGKFNPENQEGKSLLAHELTHVVQQTRRNTPASNKVNRKINFDPKTSKIKSVEFTVGAEISEAFCNLVQAELKKGKLDDKKVETFLLHLIKQNGSVSDSDRIFIASLYNHGFSSKIKSAKIKAGSMFSIKFKDVPVKKIDYLMSFGRAAAGRGSINEEAPSDALDPNDRSAVMDVLKLIILIDTYDPLIEDLAHGRLKIDRVSPAQIAQISGHPDFLAFYSPVATVTGTKGKTLYLPDNINMANAYDRSVVIHELQHARDDLNAGSKITKADSARVEFDAYVSQAQYILDSVLSAYTEVESTAYASNISVANDLVFMALIFVGSSNPALYQPALLKIWNFAPARISAHSIDTLLQINPAILEGKLLAAIQAGYGLSTGQQIALGGGTDAESFVKWFPGI